ncbi:hypothetical protein [Novosphingobium sp. BW1]|uniref:hypothetical protein n=1 Tax=Novosphingobium sp. BW1 TaxID=2592621 RepID=UPI0011DEE89A|nr:hypothetical protein [Novosphingobium sp. BW1]TYC86898.1 hypothetical protein FMM79_13630 [Novosphingobium sp. BW1]
MRLRTAGALAKPGMAQATGGVVDKPCKDIAEVALAHDLPAVERRERGQRALVATPVESGVGEIERVGIGGSHGKVVLSRAVAVTEEPRAIAGVSWSKNESLRPRSDLGVQARVRRAPWRSVPP